MTGLQRLGAVVLAAGFSSRMGEFKPLLSLEGKSVLQRAAELFSGCGRLVIVTGHRAEEVEAEARRLHVSTVLNPDFAQGMFSSVCAGVRGLEMETSGLDGFFMLPVDVALIRPWTVHHVADFFSRHKPKVAFPTFLGERGHPPLISALVVPRILAHDGRGGLRTVLEDLKGEILDVPGFDRNILLDMDTPEAFAEARQRAARLTIPDSDEAQALLDHFQLPAMGVAHGTQVARVALALTHALKDKGVVLDADLVYAAALVHDLAKGQRRHEQEGGRVLTAMGMPEMAEVVAAHRDVPPPQDGRLTEKAVVCLADKLVRGPFRISVSQRFDEKIDMYADDEEACNAILRRKRNARAVLDMVEGAIGRDVESLLAEKGLGR
jgi:CTP:molybdopterin cytidylyltransferase MocA